MAVWSILASPQSSKPVKREYTSQTDTNTNVTVVTDKADNTALSSSGVRWSEKDSDTGSPGQIAFPAVEEEGLTAVSRRSTCSLWAAHVMSEGRGSLA